MAQIFIMKIFIMKLMLTGIRGKKRGKKRDRGAHQKSNRIDMRHLAISNIMNVVWKRFQNTDIGGNRELDELKCDDNDNIDFILMMNS